jgi:hypothetical protein
MDHASRVALANKVKDYLVRQHEDLVAVWIEGSTAKGEDREHSDLELGAITRGEPHVRYEPLVWGGIVVEVDVKSQRDAFQQAATVDSHWPMWADGYGRSLPLYDPEGLLPKLVELVSTPVPSKFPLALRHSFATMYEDLCKLRNFAASEEDRLLRVLASGFAIHGIACFLGLLNRQYFNGVRDLLSKPRDFPTLPPHFWEDYPVLLAAEGTSRELLAKAERMHMECRKLLEESGSALPMASSIDAALGAVKHPR